MSGIRVRSASLVVPCPVCGDTIQTTYGAIIDEVTVTCPRGHSVQLVDQNDGVRQFERQVKKLDRTIRKLGRRR